MGTPEDSTRTLNRKTLREKRVSPHVRAVRPRRRRTRPGNAPGQVQHLKWAWARLHEKKKWSRRPKKHGRAPIRTPQKKRLEGKATNVANERIATHRVA